MSITKCAYFGDLKAAKGKEGDRICAQTSLMDELLIPFSNTRLWGGANCLSPSSSGLDRNGCAAAVG